MRRRSRWMTQLVVLAAVLLVMSAGIALTLDAAGATTIATATEPTVIYSGPGDTFRRFGILDAGVDVTIVERNDVGNWLHVQRRRGGVSEINGWVMTGHLQLDPALRFSRVPVNDTVPDADPDNVPSADLAALYAAPVIPEISPEMRLVYRRGREMGNQSSVVTKVGDSLSADPLYLSLMNRDDHILGPYDHLQETLDFFGPSTPWESVAAQVGLTSFGVFDPFWAATYCEPNETPLACEYRLNAPSVAFIMFGPNDVVHVEVADYETQMRRLIDETLASGIIPVLSTFSYDPASRTWDRAVAFNRTLIDLAREYQVPLINLWAAARPLPYYGLEGDGIHMRHSGYRMLRYDRGDEARAGVALRNLLTLQMLDELRRELPMR